MSQKKSVVKAFISGVLAFSLLSSCQGSAYTAIAPGLYLLQAHSASGAPGDSPSGGGLNLIGGTLRFASLGADAYAQAGGFDCFPDFSSSGLYLSFVLSLDLGTSGGIISPSFTFESAGSLQKPNHYFFDASSFSWYEGDATSKKLILDSSSGGEGVILASIEDYLTGDEILNGLVSLTFRVS
jgi:hypothetical protein